MKGGGGGEGGEGGKVTKATGHLRLTQPPPSVHVQYGGIIALFTEVN